MEERRRQFVMLAVGRVGVDRHRAAAQFLDQRGIAARGGIGIVGVFIAQALRAHLHRVLGLGQGRVAGGIEAGRILQARTEAGVEERRRQFVMLAVGRVGVDRDRALPQFGDQRGVAARGGIGIVGVFIAQAVPGQVDLPPAEALARAAREEMVVVVPALAEGDQRQPEIVAAVVARIETLPAPAMGQRVDRDRRVEQDHGGDEEAPHQQLLAVGAQARRPTLQRFASHEQQRGERHRHRGIEAIQPA